MASGQSPISPLDTPRILKARSRQNPPASGLCLPKLQRNHNSSVLKILQIISFVSNILKIQLPVSGLFGRLCTNRYPGEYTKCRSQIPDRSLFLNLTPVLLLRSEEHTS